METIQKRRLLFLLGCIPARLLLTYAAYATIKQQSQYAKFRTVLGLFAILVGLGFWSIYLTHSRKTGTEVFGDKIWWNSLRPLHGSLWLVAGCMILQNHPQAWVVLLVDTMIGLVSFLRKHFG